MGMSSRRQARIVSAMATAVSPVVRTCALCSLPHRGAASRYEAPEIPVVHRGLRSRAIDLGECISRTTAPVGLGERQTVDNLHTRVNRGRSRSVQDAQAFKCIFKGERRVRRAWTRLPRRIGTHRGTPVNVGGCLAKHEADRTRRAGGGEAGKPRAPTTVCWRWVASSGCCWRRLRRDSSGSPSPSDVRAGWGTTGRGRRR